MFALRFAFGMLVLGIMALNYLGQSRPGRVWYSPGELSIGELAQFGRALCASIMSAQAALVLGLTPALVADAIASERTRKTLHYLLASPLGSLEIILGKLAARLLSVGVYPVLALPILSMLTLIGGISPAGLVLGSLAFASSAYFLAGLSLLASVLTRRPRDAIGAAYSLTAAWLILPPFLDVWAPLLLRRWPEIAEAIPAINAWVWPASPLGLVTNAVSIFSGGVDELARLVLWMVGSQLVYGTLFTALAAWQLRPSFRRHEGREGRQTASTRLARRYFPVRPCGDDPMFWKEAFFSSATGGLGGRIARSTVTTMLVVAVIGTLVASRAAVGELLEHGYGNGPPAVYGQRLALNLGLRYGCALMTGIWMLWLASQTAAGISSEREQDTWIGLLATPLERSEILRGKMLGPLRATARFPVALGALWVIGLAAGAVHPLGLLNAVVVAAILVWFTTALGTFISLRTQLTSKARLWTQAILIAPHVCCMLPIPSPLILLGISLWSYAEIHWLWSAEVFSGPEPHLILFAVAYYFGGMAFYAGAAYFLTRSLFRRFDTLADRPRRPLQEEVVLVALKPAPDKDRPEAGNGLP
jgi:ABC-type transport system involved in multi-copper enzyme maturation permease subunit